MFRCMTLWMGVALRADRLCAGTANARRVSKRDKFGLR
ncbi:hypothetical protein ABIE49_002175 [Bradyrhizobium sp. OAE829]